MLVLSRSENEGVAIGDDIQLTVVEIRGDKVRLGVVVPKEIPVHRQEVYDAIHGRQAPAVIDPAWLTPHVRAGIDPTWLAWNDGTVLRLARAIFEQGNYDALPILADALEEAGCVNADILDPCRSCGPDIRSS